MQENKTFYYICKIKEAVKNDWHFSLPLLYTFIFMEICQIMTLLPVSDVISGGAVCLYACMKVDVFLLIEALSREISCRNEACAVEA